MSYTPLKKQGTVLMEGIKTKSLELKRRNELEDGES